MIKLPKRDKLSKTKNWVSIPFALTLTPFLEIEL